MGSPLRLGIFSALQQVSDRQRQREAAKEAKQLSLEERLRSHAMQDAAAKRQATLDQASMHSRTIEDRLHEAQLGAVNAKTKAGPKPKQLPSNAVEKMVGIDNMISNASEVQRSLEDAVSSKNNATGRFLGFKTPTAIKNMVGMGGEKGLHTRTVIGSLKATIAKERAGTSMTPGELDLLESYVPNDNDDEKVALAKAKDFMRTLHQVKTNRSNAYAKYGYGTEEPQQPDDDEHLPYSSYDP